MVWWIWLVVGLIIGVIELFTVTFVLLWFAVAALVTTVFALASHSLWFQVAVFVVVSVVLLIVTRPLAQRWKQNKTYPTRSDSIEHQTGVVVTEAEPGAFATVRVQGELWSAKSDQPLHRGQEVEVKRATATILTVEPTHKVGM